MTVSWSRGRGDNYNDAAGRRRRPPVCLVPPSVLLCLPALATCVIYARVQGESLPFPAKVVNPDTQQLSSCMLNDNKDSYNTATSLTGISSSSFFNSFKDYWIIKCLHLHIRFPPGFFAPSNVQNIQTENTIEVLQYLKALNISFTHSNTNEGVN